MPRAYRVIDEIPLRFHVQDPAGAHLSAASGMGWLGDELVVIDDASTFAGLFHHGSPPGQSLRLFPPVNGHDRFSEVAGTKALKPDLEVLVPLPDGSLLALGSGSLATRMRGARIRAGRAVEVVDLGPVFAALAARLQCELNLEGALAHGNALHLLLRGNGRGSRPAAVTLADWQAALFGEPTLGAVVEIALPSLGGVPLGITDACTLPDGTRLVALAAEDTGDAYADGAVHGSALYDLARGELVPLYHGHGVFTGKLEGICPSRSSDAPLLGVTDPDDPTRPGSLLVIAAD